jgi:RNA polymerase sigma factor (TIGR02999 family)
MPDEHNHVTGILEQLSAGDGTAVDRLLPHVYQELRALAGSFFRQQRANHTLQPTALVHEAYLRLVRADASWSSRKHFYDVAAMAMRQLLTDHARTKKSEKRGGGTAKITLSEANTPLGYETDVDIVVLDEALTKLNELDPRQARIVELRFLAGLTVEQTAEILGVSDRTVKLDWRMAKAWLKTQLGGA